MKNIMTDTENPPERQISPTIGERLLPLLQRLPLEWAPPAEVILIGTSMLVGLGTGLGAVIFIKLLAQINHLAQWTQTQLGDVTGLLVVMVAAGLVVGFIVDRWAREAKGHGVPEVMEAVALRDGRIRPRVAVIKVLASSITIGAGGSAGREGPIVQVGSALGSTLAQVLHFSDERIRTLVACGAAAGISATFNAPIAGSIFALEIILGRFTVRYFGAVVISAVSASVISRFFLSNQPAFIVPAYPLNHLAEIPLYIILGILAAFVAVLFIRFLYAAEEIFDKWRIPLTFKAGLGMLLTAFVALLLPGRDVLGPGLHLIGEAIAEDFNLPLTLMVVLLGTKLLATTFTLGSGNSGGVFAPSLYMGAILGGIVGTIGHALWPDIVANPGAYAIVGMAAVFSGAARAPITAVLIVFEMSGDYKLILPLMMATVLSTLLAEHLFTESIYTLKLKLRGIRLTSGRDEDVLRGVQVKEVMTCQIDTVSPDTTLATLARLLDRTHIHGLPVVTTENRLWGVVTVSDLDKAIQSNRPLSANVSEIATPYPRLLLAYPDESIGHALERMSVRGLGRMPVVAREDPYQLLGLVRRADIIRAYKLGLNRRAEKQYRTQQAALQNLDGLEFLDVVLGPDDPVVGRMLRDFAGALPAECVLVSIRRDGQLLIPHGNTVFLAGDKITAFVRPEDAGILHNCLHLKTDN